MTPHPRYNAYLWLLVGAVVLTIVLWLFGCGSGGPTTQMARTVRFVVEAQCSDLDPVKECLDKIDKSAAAVDSAIDGGLP